jgi:hypothetical protein
MGVTRAGLQIERDLWTRVLARYATALAPTPQAIYSTTETSPPSRSRPGLPIVGQLSVNRETQPSVAGLGELRVGRRARRSAVDVKSRRVGPLSAAAVAVGN